MCFSACKPLPFIQSSVVPALALFDTLVDTAKDPDALQDLVKRIRVSISQMCDVCDAANHVGFFGCCHGAV